MSDFWSQSYDQSTYLRQHSSKVQQYNVKTCGKDTALTTAWEICKRRLYNFSTGYLPSGRISWYSVKKTHSNKCNQTFFL